MKRETKQGVVCDYFSNLDPEPFHETADGFLSGRAVVTTIGVFPYLLEDGSIFRELRLPEEVFDDTSLETLKMKPITNNHPSELVNPSNAGKLQVGSIGEDVSRFDNYSGSGYTYKTDGTTLSVPLMITDKTAIDGIKGGKRALSCGYSRDLELTDGEWCGQHYDGIQRNIRYNHVAIVDRGRAGDAALIRMDGVDVPTFFEKEKEKKVIIDRKDNKEIIMSKIVLDGKNSYDVDAAVKAKFDTMSTELETLKKDYADLKNAKDVVDGSNAVLQGQLDTANAAMSKMIKADALPLMVKAQKDIEMTADSFGIKLSDDMSMIDMKKAIIKVAIPSMADSIDEKEDAFIDGAFDTCKGMKIDTGIGEKREKKTKIVDTKEETVFDNAGMFSFDTLSANLNERLSK